MDADNRCRVNGWSDSVAKNEDFMPMTELDVPPVSALLAKISRQTTRINSLENEVELLRKQLEERDLERSRVEEAAEQVLRELAVVPVEELENRSAGDESFATANNNDSTGMPENQENDSGQLQTSLGEGNPSAAKKYGSSFKKDTFSSVEYKYQVLIKRHEAQSREITSLRSELHHMKRSKRRSSWEKWEGDLAEEKIRQLEEYVAMLEQSHACRAPDITQVLIKEIHRGRNELKELREALFDTRTELQMTKSKELRADSVLTEIASLMNLDTPSAYSGREEVLVAAVENAQQRATYSQNLAVKAKTLLTVAIEERERLEQLFQTARKENERFGIASRISAVLEDMNRYQTLARAYPELAECMEDVHLELQGVNGTRMVLEKEMRKCRKVITQTLEKSSDILDVPLSSRRTNFDSLSDGVTLLARLAVSQLQQTPIKSCQSRENQ